jgi:hypothetical protein
MEEFKAKQGKSNKVLSIFAIIILSFLIIALFYFWITLNDRIVQIIVENFSIKSDMSNLKKEINRLETNLKYIDDKMNYNFGVKTVDLTKPDAQDVGSGFFVCNLDMKEHLSGIKLSGRMINTLSVVHTNVNFSVKLGTQEQDFTINLISPGNSTAFTVYIPDVKSKDTSYGQFSYRSSAIRFYTK